MRTNINIDDGLMDKAFKLSGLNTKTAVVDAALREFIERRERKDLSELRGQLQFADGYDYKSAREERPHGSG